jgi:hypothetical protein
MIPKDSKIINIHANIQKRYLYLEFITQPLVHSRYTFISSCGMYYLVFEYPEAMRDISNKISAQIIESVQIK